MPEVKPVSSEVSVSETDSGSDGLPRLVNDLRENADLADTPADVLAAQYGLSSSLVKALIQELAERDQLTSAIVNGRRRVFKSARESMRQIRQMWLDLTERPYRFVIAVVLLMGSAQLVVAAGFGLSIVTVGLMGLLFFLSSPFLLGCILRWGKPMLAVTAAGVEFLFLLSAILIFQWLHRSATPDPGQAGSVASAISIAFLFCSAALIIGIITAFIGHIAREVRYNRSERRLARQALLDRSFTLETKLAAMEKSHFSETPTEKLAAALRTHAQYPLVILALALAIGVVEVSAVSSAAFSVHPVLPEMLRLLLILFLVLKTLFVLTAGYLAPTPRAALISMVIAYVGTTITMALPRDGYGLALLMAYVQSWTNLITLGLVLLGGLVIGSVLEANRSEMKRRRIAANDPATVAAEIVRTHWRLYGKQRSICVLVVDVSGSTRMKADSDPARVEYSFRAYQSLIADLTEARGGKVISTAGDGAVCSFPDAQSAMEAARDLHTAMPEFNAKTNRLSSPFRIRIGLHAGESEVDLTHAPFNRLIDVAAHVEKVAPVGGVAATNQVVMQLPEERFVELAQAIDDYGVSVVMNPTRGA